MSEDPATYHAGRPARHVMIDLETLGNVPGCAVIQIGAVAFTFEDGPKSQFFVHVEPPATSLIQVDTLDWARRHGTWPPPDDAVLLLEADALMRLTSWAAALRPIVSWWSWGSTFDFPMLEAIFARRHVPVPWDYWQMCCARTVWRLAFGDERRPSRPHNALDDALAAVADLQAAARKLSNSFPFSQP